MYNQYTIYTDGYKIILYNSYHPPLAQQDGRLIPGDRLMFVNDVDLSHACLDEAVQALKGAARGNVRVGVSKPLPVPDSSTTISQNSSHAESSADNTEVRSEISDMDTDVGEVLTPPPNIIQVRKIILDLKLKFLRQLNILLSSSSFSSSTISKNLLKLF